MRVECRRWDLHTRLHGQSEVLRDYAHTKTFSMKGKVSRYVIREIRLRSSGELYKCSEEEYKKFVGLNPSSENYFLNLIFSVKNMTFFYQALDTYLQSE